MPGESVSFVLSQDQETLAAKDWSTEFPQVTTTSLLRFARANVHGEDLLAELLHHSAFTQDDLAELSSSEIPELRYAAVRNLTDQATLAKIAVEEQAPDVRQAAVEKLTDQAFLEKIAAEDNVPAVRQAAERRLAQLRNNPK